MYQRVENNQRMTDNDACIRYEDSYIVIGRDSMDSEIGAVLYIGDDMGELISLMMEIDEPYCGIVEGLSLRRSLGGVVVGG